jgi:hypothetical protein
VSANNDERQCAKRDRFDLRRAPSKHLSGPSGLPVTLMPVPL